jgi:hypothetical protein
LSSDVYRNSGTRMAAGANGLLVNMRALKDGAIQKFTKPIHRLVGALAPVIEPVQFVIALDALWRLAQTMKNGRAR